MNDYTEFWQLEDSITTIVEANGSSVWGIRKDGDTICVELAQHLDEDAMSALCCQLPLCADYGGEGSCGTVFVMQCEV